jgi:hypothetical protein
MEGSTTDYNRATRIVASSAGAIAGLAGMEHGPFEVLQGNAMTSGLVIEAIGPAQRFWEHGTEPAMTVVPNLLTSGILAMVVGLSVMVWAIALVDRKYGVGVLAILSGLMLFLGGGFAPVVYAVVPIVAAIAIDKPVTWWRTRLHPGLRSLFARLWPASLVAFAFLSLLAVATAVFG